MSFVYVIFFVRKTVNWHDKAGHAPLWYAFHNSQPKIVTVLLHNGANFLELSEGI